MGISIGGQYEDSNISVLAEISAWIIYESRATWIFPVSEISRLIVKCLLLKRYFVFAADLILFKCTGR